MLRNGHLGRLQLPGRRGVFLKRTRAVLGGLALARPERQRVALSGAGGAEASLGLLPSSPRRCQRFASANATRRTSVRVSPPAPAASGPAVGEPSGASEWPQCSLLEPGSRPAVACPPRTRRVPPGAGTAVAWAGGGVIWAQDS